MSLRAAGSRCLMTRLTLDRDQDVPSGLDRRGVRLADSPALVELRQHDRRNGPQAGGGDRCQVHLHDWLASRDSIADLRQTLKAGALEADCLEPEMHEQRQRT